MEPQVTHPEAPSHYTSVALAAGWQPDPITVEGTAGGGVGAGSQSRGCTGWITSNPSHLVQLQTPLPFLRIAVSSSSDTTLVIRTPDGRFLCADDSGLDVNPHIDQSDAAPGDYAVWVGSYARGGSAAYTMSITELP
jgi:hypothetical protein